LANVDELMAELLLPEDAETRSYSRLRTSVTSSIVQSNVTSPTPPTTSPHRHQQQHHYLMQQQPSPLGTLVSSTAGSPQQQQVFLHYQQNLNKGEYRGNEGKFKNRLNSTAGVIHVYSYYLKLFIFRLPLQLQSTPQQLNL
jgi:hypothetical protein